MRTLFYLCSILAITVSVSRYAKADFQLSESDVQKADEIARETASWFDYTTGPVRSEHLGQCSDYAVRFVLKFNEYAGRNSAKIVIANNPIPSGIYRLGQKTDVSRLGFQGFAGGVSGILNWGGQLYIYHPVIGAYAIYLEKALTPKVHFGVNMLDKTQTHVWATVGNISVDPTYFDVLPNKFSSPLGSDQ